jgi:hypothetical protein
MPHNNLAALKFYLICLTESIILSIHWIEAIDIAGKILSTIMGIVVFVWAWLRFKKDMKLKAVEVEIKNLELQQRKTELENVQQKQYQLMAKNKELQ